MAKCRFGHWVKDIQLLRAKSEDVDIGFWCKWRMWLSGFCSQSYVLFSLDEHNRDDYVSDIVRLKKTPRFNGYYSVMLYDKLYFAQMMRGFSENMPATYGLIKDGRFCGFESEESFVELCRRVESVVIKPLTGSCGDGVKVVGVDDFGRWRLNNHEVCESDLAVKIASVDDCLVTEFVEQHSYSRKIYPDSGNTVRIQTMWDEDYGKPFIGPCFHRFGTCESAPVDNCCMGGVHAWMDSKSGKLGEAWIHEDSWRFATRRDHPETGELIEGIVVPRWDAITSRVLEMASSLPFLCWVGWDIIVTEDGFKVIEGNNYPDLYAYQLHEPFLKNMRVRKFFERRLAALEKAERVGARHKLPFRL